MGFIPSKTYTVLMISEPEPLFEIFRESLCVVTKQKSNGPIHINDLKNGPEVVKNSRGPAEKRLDLAREFSRRVRSESGLKGCTFEYPLANPRHETFGGIWNILRNSDIKSTLSYLKE
jgi:hypothetical protein